jgi:predicted nucleotidyltransferase component of viral defense system
MGVREAIVEKDFWVCWMLDYLFHDSPWKDKMAFKGGTSLSKAYKAIERFSEDVDLILDWRELGYIDADFAQELSSSKQARFNKEANNKCVEFLRERFIPAVREDLSSIAGTDISIDIDEHDTQSILVRYPKAFSLAAIRPEIVLEIGPLAAWAPVEPKDIQSYAAVRFPDLFRQKSSVVPTVIAERTFWDKATILHQEAHRPADRVMPSRYSRHYYDLYRLSQLDIRASSLKQLDLLEKVVAFKEKFYHSGWASYGTAKPGTFKLMPSAARLSELRRDYESTKPMLFGTVPGLDEITTELELLECEINSHKDT